MPEALIAALIGLCGVLGALGYHETSRRVHKLEMRQALILRALIGMTQQNGLEMAPDTKQAILKAIEAAGE